MIIQLFNNKNFLVHGEDNKRLTCERSGTLRIGNTEIPVKANEENILPPLFFGASADFKASFVTADGDIYEGGKVSVRSGRLLSAPPEKVEMMELHIRCDEAEKRQKENRKDIDMLKKLFDTNSLNFIMKGDYQ
jgi:hypothetical protein